MSDFENTPQSTSTEDVTQESVSTGESAATGAEKAFAKAETSVLSFMKEINEQAAEAVDDDSLVRIKGTDRRLEELPDEYRKLALAQKRESLIQEKIDTVLADNEQSKPGSQQEANSYFGAQILAHAKEVEGKRAALQAQVLGFKHQHPDIYQAQQQGWQN